MLGPGLSICIGLLASLLSLRILVSHPALPSPSALLDLLCGLSGSTNLINALTPLFSQTSAESAILKKPLTSNIKMSFPEFLRFEARLLLNQLSLGGAEKPVSFRVTPLLVRLCNYLWFVILFLGVSQITLDYFDRDGVLVSFLHAPLSESLEFRLFVEITTAWAWVAATVFLVCFLLISLVNLQVKMHSSTQIWFRGGLLKLFSASAHRFCQLPRHLRRLCEGFAAVWDIYGFILGYFLIIIGIKLQDWKKQSTVNSNAPLSISQPSVIPILALFLFPCLLLTAGVIRLIDSRMSGSGKVAPSLRLFGLLLFAAEGWLLAMCLFVDFAGTFEFFMSALGSFFQRFKLPPSHETEQTLWIWLFVNHTSAPILIEHIANRSDGISDDFRNVTVFDSAAPPSSLLLFVAGLGCILFWCGQLILRESLKDLKC